MATTLIGAQNEYDRFVGAYIREYARLEFVLRIAFQQHSGLDEETYEILIGLPRTGEVVSKLQKLFPRVATDPNSKAEAVRAFNQLQALTKLRDNVVHYGGQPHGSKQVLVRCKPTQLMKATGFSHSIHDWSELHGAQEDLTLIADFIHFHLIHQPKEKVVREILRKSVSLPKTWKYCAPEIAQPR